MFENKTMAEEMTAALEQEGGRGERSGAGQLGHLPA